MSEEMIVRKATDEEERKLIEDRVRLTSLVKGQYEQDYKIAGYILAGHGAGMLTCLAALKDYKDSPPFRGIGIFIVLFGLGIITSCLSYMSLAGLSHRMYGLLSRMESRERVRRAALQHEVTAYASMGLMVIAVGLIMWKFARL